MLTKKEAANLPPAARKRREVNDSLYSGRKRNVLKHYSNKCFVTGSIFSANNRVECHHLIGWWHEPTRYHTANGVALCKAIHTQFHKLYGWGHNLTSQFEEFCTNRYNITEFPWRESEHKLRFTLQQEVHLLAEEKSLLRAHALHAGFNPLPNGKQMSVKLTQKTLARKGKVAQFMILARQRQHTVISGVYYNNQSHFVLFCSKHHQTQSISVKGYKNNGTGLRCCASEKISNNQSTNNSIFRKKPRLTPANLIAAKLVQKQNRLDNSRQKKTTQFTNLVRKRNHIVISGDYIGWHSKFVVFCPKHGYQQCVSFTQYTHKHIKVGLKCCASELLSERAITVVRPVKKAELTPNAISQQIEAKSMKKKKV